MVATTLSRIICSVVDLQAWISYNIGMSQETSESELKLREIVRLALPDYALEFNVRPYWLVNRNSNHTLELDIYVPVLKLAFEYQGWQHWRAAPDKGITQMMVESQRVRDRSKARTCFKHRVSLYRVYFNNLKDALFPAKVKEWALHAKAVIDGQVWAHQPYDQPLEFEFKGKVKKLTGKQSHHLRKSIQKNRLIRLADGNKTLLKPHELTPFEAQVLQNHKVKLTMKEQAKLVAAKRARDASQAARFKAGERQHKRESKFSLLGQF